MLKIGKSMSFSSNSSLPIGPQLTQLDNSPSVESPLSLQGTMEQPSGSGVLVLSRGRTVTVLAGATQKTAVPVPRTSLQQAPYHLDVKVTKSDSMNLEVIKVHELDWLETLRERGEGGQQGQEGRPRKKKKKRAYSKKKSKTSLSSLVYVEKSKESKLKKNLKSHFRSGLDSKFKRLGQMN